MRSVRRSFTQLLHQLVAIARDTVLEVLSLSAAHPSFYAKSQLLIRRLHRLSEYFSLDFTGQDLPAVLPLDLFGVLQFINVGLFFFRNPELPRNLECVAGRMDNEVPLSFLRHLCSQKESPLPWRALVRGGPLPPVLTPPAPHIDEENANNTLATEVQEKMSAAFAVDEQTDSDTPLLVTPRAPPRDAAGRPVEALDRCSLSVTGDTYAMMEVYSCNTCGLTGVSNMFVCLGSVCCCGINLTQFSFASGLAAAQCAPEFATRATTASSTKSTVLVGKQFERKFLNRH